MPFKKFRPLTPSLRYTTTDTFEDVTTGTPERSLVEKLHRTSGRNNAGRITSRRRGGGHPRLYRVIDFKRDKFGIPAKVKSIEYDPNRTARIALLVYADGEKRYIIAPDGIAVGDELMSGPTAPVRPGNALPLTHIPAGSTVHNVEMKPGKGAALARSAGALVQLISREGDMARLRMPSGEVRLVPSVCMATLGQVGHVDRDDRSLGKAGRNRWLGRRPSVRGVAMNPVDHPHGGGEGRTSGGGGKGSHPRTPWGVITKGKKTRNPKKSSRLIISRRTK
ncbi:MAG TPA: 50S ribosomal protein L2 [Candidatus Latescibacteria bacterium]|nr:MAG: 50S ribosomal protein L2 [Candidatus Latescibacteria bacterium ADurb.Bin168]HPU84683.1 50S ribosomal protein L2 [Candidatus Latescibacterota bacterium]